MEGAARKSDLENDVTRKVNQILRNILFFLFITLRPPTSFFLLLSSSPQTLSLLFENG